MYMGFLVTTVDNKMQGLGRRKRRRKEKHSFFIYLFLFLDNYRVIF